MKRMLFLLSLLFVLSLAINIFLIERLQNKPQLKTPENSQEQFPYLARRILIENPTDILINFSPLRTQLRVMVKEYGESFAFYFEYLPTGTSIGVNEKLEFESASLIKVPVVMAHYKSQERKGIDRGMEMVTIQEKYIDKGFGNLWQKGAGAQIRLEEAVRLALTESDNTAANIVSDNAGSQDFEDVYGGLDIDLHKNTNGTILLTTKGYSSILKALYFASVLNKEHSQKIIELLTHSSFNDKLRAGVPANIIVANKYGVLGDQLFHDCGIVYYQNRPYLLCMVSKSSEGEARERMKKFSAAVYEYISTVNKKENP